MMTLRKRAAAAWAALLSPERIFPGADDQRLSRVAFHPPGRLINADLTTVEPSAPYDDEELVERIIKSYRLANARFQDDVSLWGDHFRGAKTPIHEALMADNFPAVAEMLRNPASSQLLLGFDGLVQAETPSTDSSSIRTSRYLYDNLFRLGEALGALRLDNPEATPEAHSPPLEVDAILDAIEATLGFKLSFPNLYPGEQGLTSKRGIISHRPVQAILQAKILKDHHGDGQVVVEIGAGLGRTTYYASSLFGIKDYTIVDLPMSNVAQSYFLGRTLGSEAISLFGEPDRRVRVLPPQAFFDEARRYDIALNVDSLTEMTRPTATRYYKQLAFTVPVFISINHEFNAYTVRELSLETPTARVERSPYWLRHGYVQEIVRFDQP